MLLVIVYDGTAMATIAVMKQVFAILYSVNVV